MKKILLALTVLFLFSMTSCGNNTPKPPDVKEDLLFENITLKDKTVPYDGEVHTILIEGKVPSGASVIYTNNQQTQPGTYEVTAIISGFGYQTLTLKATLTIKPKQITNITLNDKTVTYDGNLHKLEITGTIPQGVIVSYTSNIDGVLNETSEVGEYHITATLSGVGYDTLTLTATLTINPYGKETFKGITFENKTVTYDGLTHAITITGTPPEGTQITYSSTTEGITNQAKAVGSYTVTVTLEKEGYQSLTLQAQLVIIEGELNTFENITFDNLTVEYDSFEHEIVIEGILPKHTQVTYTSNHEGMTNKATDVGIYQVKATLSKAGYETLELTAKLTIKAVDKERFIYTVDDTIYFTNGLDKENLYSIKAGLITKVNNDEAKYYVTHQDKIHYVSSGLISSSIKRFENETATSLYSANAQYLLSDGIYLYYALNPLFGKKGIFKLDLTGEEPIQTKIFSGKATYLTLIGNDIYFINHQAKDAIYKIAKTANDGEASLVVEEKTKEMIYHDGSLYYTVNNLLGDYLERYIISTNKKVKLTQDNAKYLTIAGDYIYYSNVDKLTSNIYGKGLYRVLAKKTESTSGAGERIYETAYNVSSLYASGDRVLFYNIENKHLMSLDTKNFEVTDLMADFEPPLQETTQLLNKFETAVWQNRIYYINNYQGGTLYYYDINLDETIKVTSNGVKSFSIIGDYLYFNQISWLVNNDIYRVNLKTGGDIEMISKNDGRDMVIYNGYLYYVRANASGVGTAINGINLSTLENKEYEGFMNNAYHLRIYNGKLYYITGGSNTAGKLIRADIDDMGNLLNPTQIGVDDTTYFIFVGDQIYFRRLFNFNNRSKSLAKMDLDGANKVDLISDIDPVSFIIKEGYIYYTNDTILGTNGIYKVPITDDEPLLILENTTDIKFASNMQIVGNYLYFYSEKGDKKLYKLNLTTLDVMVIE